MNERLSAHTEPLCGGEWLRQHRSDYTQAEIDNLTIQVSRNGNKLPAIANTKGGKKVLKEVMDSYGKER